MADNHSVAQSMNKTGKQWEGQVVDGRFLLQKYLGQSDHSIAFLTERNAPASQRAAIKLIADDPAYSGATLAAWNQAATLSHPNILQVFESGRCTLGDFSLLYVVMEYAEENLAEILPERRLTSGEAKQMLPPVLSALAYLHGQGFVHGHLKPSNVMATADQVKLSGDGVRPVQTEGRPDRVRVARAYDPPESAQGVFTPAGDVWSLGGTLTEVSALRLAAGVGGGAGVAEAPVEDQQFREILSHCLDPDPKRRLTVAQISNWLDESSAPVKKPTSAEELDDSASGLATLWRKPLVKWGAIAVVAVIAILFFGLKGRRSVPQSQVGQTIASEQPVDQPQIVPAPPRVASKDSTATRVSAASTKQSSGTVPGSVRDRILPNVSPSARKTIQGHIRVGVRVNVDAAGNVTRASLQSRGPSEYFARLAQESAQRWTFSPAQVNGQPVASEWILRYAFGREDTDVHPAQVSP
jgi:TonB family protein